MGQRAQWVAVVFQKNGQWYERSVTVDQLWMLVRDPQVTQLETV